MQNYRKLDIKITANKKANKIALGGEKWITKKQALILKLDTNQ